MIPSKIIRLLSIQFLVVFTGVIGLSSNTLAQQEKISHIEQEQGIKIQSIEITGNTVFSDDEFEQILAPYKGKSFSFDWLLQVHKTIDDYYSKRGYITQSILLAQEITNGKIEIQIIEGVLEDIQFKGLNSLRENYLKARLPPIGKPLNIQQVVKSLERLRNDPLIKEINGHIDQENIAKNILSVYVEENPAVTATVNIIDGYSPAVGRVGGVIFLSHNNFWGFGDRLSIRTTQSDGINRIGGEASIPFNKLDGRFTFAISNVDSKVVEQELKALGIENEFFYLSFGIRQPIISTLTDQLSLGFSLDFKDGETFVLEDISFPLTRGLEDGKTRITSLNFYQQYIKNGSRSLFAINSNFSVGIDLFDPTITDVGIDGLYWLWRGDIQYLVALNAKKNIILATRIGIQVTPDQLHPFEQITIGGRDNIRGYRPNIGVADNGIWGILEANFILVKHKKLGSIAIIPSVGIGGTWNNSRDTVGSNTFASVGIGLRYSVQDILEIRADYAKPIIDLTGFGTTNTEDNYSFSLLLNPLNLF